MLLKRTQVGEKLSHSEHLRMFDQVVSDEHTSNTNRVEPFFTLIEYTVVGF